MNRNINDKNTEIEAISNAIYNLKSENGICNFLLDLLTKSEVETLSKRWRILTMLSEGKTQRDIAQDLKVSLCKVTRGAKILKNNKSVVTKYLIKEKK